MSRPIYLYGPPGSGKSTLGKVLARRLGLDFTDLDSVIVDDAGGMSIPEIFAGEGERGFRARELAALKSVASKGAGQVVALGGGALLDPEAHCLAEDTGDILFLDVPYDVIEKRIMAEAGSRPLAGKAEKVRSLMEARKDHYAGFHLRLVQTDGSEDIESRASRAETVLGRFRIDAFGTSSDIFVGPGLLRQVGGLAAERIPGRRAVAVIDRNVGRTYMPAIGALESAGIEVETLVLDLGEERKTLETVRLIWDACFKAGLGRRDFLVSFGGGVTGDLTGFAAATWMRGIDWVNIPTTVLSMVDASTGGKTGFDIPGGKNMIGAFHPPRLVIVDPDSLFTLPERETRSGLAEAIKHGLLADSGLVESLVEGISSNWRTGEAEFCANALDANRIPVETLSRALAVKVAVVRQDPGERKGLRAKLNLGHTIGHAIEVATGYRLRHGEAVAIGCVEAARLARRLFPNEVEAAWPDTVRDVFIKAGLPVELPEGVALEALKPIMAGDKKKVDGGTVSFVLPFAPEDVRLVPLRVEEL